MVLRRVCTILVKISVPLSFTKGLHQKGHPGRTSRNNLASNKFRSNLLQVGRRRNDLWISKSLKWAKVLADVQKGFNLGLLIFNSFISSRVFVICLANYVDDNTMYISDRGFSNINSLSDGFTVLPKWFYNNCMVLNRDKCPFMLLGVNDNRGEYRAFLRSVAASGRLKISSQILIDQLKI